MIGPTLAGKRIAVYTRSSGESQRETSLEDQVRRARDFATRFGGVVDEALVFADLVRTRPKLHRPQFQNLMKAVEDGRVDAILTDDLSRLSKDMSDAAKLFELGVLVATVRS